MAFPPEAYLIGAAKCGTTTLTDLLEQHPGLCLSTPRDADFFTRNYSRGFDWYRGLFPGDEESVYLDVSLSYGQAPLSRQGADAGAYADPRIGVPERIHAARPDAKFIYIVREPVSRAFSMYLHNRRHGYREGSFREALEANPSYIDGSNYAGQIRCYLEYFPIASFHVILFERMARDPVETARECLEFLGVQPPDYPLSYSKPSNEGFQYNRVGRLMQQALRNGERLDAVINTCKRMVPERLRPFAARLITSDQPSLDPADREWLQERFAEPNRDLERLTGLTLDDWR